MYLLAEGGRAGSSYAKVGGGGSWLGQQQQPIGTLKTSHWLKVSPGYQYTDWLVSGSAFNFAVIMSDKQMLVSHSHSQHFSHFNTLFTLTWLKDINTSFKLTKKIKYFR